MRVKTTQWDLESVRPGGREVALEEQMEQIVHQLERRKSELEKGNEDTLIEEAVENILHVQELQTKIFELDEYIICRQSTNVTDAKWRDMAGRCSILKSKFNTMMVSFRLFLAKISITQWEQLVEHPEVRSARFYLNEERRKMEDQLSPEMEALIHDLAVDGFDGWEDHYEQELSNLRVRVEANGEAQSIPFSQAFVQAAFSHDRRVRKAVGEEILNTCEANADRFASIFNHFAGFRNELYRIRDWSNPLKEMLDQNRIRETTISSLMNTLHEHKHLLHQFFQRKAELSKVDKLTWYDTQAPTYTSETSLTYDEAAQIIIRQFHSFSEKLGVFAERAFEQGWIDAEPSEHKRHGAFCASLPAAEESRVLLSFTGSYQDVVTLAHELGHAYHNLILHEQPGFARQIGTGLAETASTFLENLVLDAAIEHAETKTDQLSLLEMKITNGLKYTAFIPAKFEFERAFYERRKHGALSADELVQLNTEKEEEWFKGTLADVNGYTWMTIPHFYSTEKAYYNLPYTIGYLFSNGLYSMYLKEREGFPIMYDQLLENSGKRTMEELGREFLNEDLTGSDFWEASLEPLKDAVEKYIKLTK